MYKGIIIFLICEFIFGALLAFLTKGFTNLEKLGTILTNSATHLVQILFLIWLIKFSTFPFLDDIVAFGLGILLLMLSLLIIVLILGMWVGDILESIILSKK